MGKADAERDFNYTSSGPLFEQEPIARVPLEEVDAIGPDEKTEVPTGAETPVPLEEVQRRIKVREAEYDELKDRLTSSNWPPGRIAQELDAKFPDLRTPERIEELDKQQLAGLRRQARAEGKAQPKSRTVYISPRDTGPPPHIARQIRGEE